MKTTKKQQVEKGRTGNRKSIKGRESKDSCERGDSPKKQREKSQKELEVSEVVASKTRRIKGTTKSGSEIKTILDGLKRKILTYRKKYPEPTLDATGVQCAELAQKSRNLYFGAYGTEAPKSVDGDDLGLKRISVKRLKFESRLNRMMAAKLFL